MLATKHYHEYDEAAVDRVFRAVAPVLKRGRPSRTPLHGPQFRIVHEDAADVS